MVTLGNRPRRVCVGAAGVHLLEGKEDGGVRAGASGKNWMLILVRHWLLDPFLRFLSTIELIIS